MNECTDSIVNQVRSGQVDHGNGISSMEVTIHSIAITNPELPVRRIDQLAEKFKVGKHHFDPLQSVYMAIFPSKAHVRDFIAAVKAELPIDVS